MRKHYFGLLVSLLVSGALVAAAGICVKANLPEDYAYYRQHNAVALPFVLMADGKLPEVVSAEWFLLTAETEPTYQDATVATTVDTEPSEAPTEQAIQPPTETQTSTEPPTEPTEAPTEPAEPVDDSFFDHTLFIGDSRMCGLRDFARMGGADYFCDVGMTVFNLWERSATDYGYGTMDLKDLLGLISYDRIYISLGINEAGYPMKNFKTEYDYLIRTLRQMQPDAVIVLQSVMAVTEEYAAGRSYFLPEYLAQMNEFIASFADGQRIFYMDVNEAVTDENGYLLKDLTLDGCHLLAKQVPIWADWLKRSIPRE